MPAPAPARPASVPSFTDDRAVPRRPSASGPAPVPRRDAGAGGFRLRSWSGGERAAEQDVRGNARPLSAWTAA